MNPYDLLVEKLEILAFRACIEKLSPRQRYVMEQLCLGRSYRDIGNDFEVSPERIRQIRLHALREIRIRCLDLISEPRAKSIVTESVRKFLSRIKYDGRYGLIAPLVWELEARNLCFYDPEYQGYKLTELGVEAIA